jgi:hypothetical protein
MPNRHKNTTDMPKSKHQAMKTMDNEDNDALKFHDDGSYIVFNPVHCLGYTKGDVS